MKNMDNFEEEIQIDTEEKSETGMLFVVATPIGNMEDITLRALRILNECDLIICEDTRVAKKLFFRHNVSKPLLAIPQRAADEKIRRVLDVLRTGKNVALTTDAGTPGVSDPGNEVVEKVIAAGFCVSPVPGPSALAALLSVAGVNTQEFLFKGFPPHKKGRETFFRAIAQSKVPVVYYESPYRVVKNLELLASLASERNVIIGRELTKMFEEIQRGSVGEVLEYYQKNPGKVKGEFVVMVM
ncbi:MAG: 16S rRNA (cytidine(1402)-2'-O)-methyltransferase [Candidatus Moraniibacteriota bacterium]|nr:MAG: 16S rRNA (cytidine(1402)-2'-O)-methyltransferase [Candidatus Moranbacteria bacterium]